MHMETEQSAPTTRSGTPGLDVFKIAGRSISGFVPSWKTGDPLKLRQPFTTQLEERLALYRVSESAVVRVRSVICRAL